jgi:hypothetical protein
MKLLGCWMTIFQKSKVIRMVCDDPPKKCNACTQTVQPVPTQYARCQRCHSGTTTLTLFKATALFLSLFATEFEVHQTIAFECCLATTQGAR